jgi:CRP/FNR family transcriptional regulator, cyclic AMP receptor protein
VAPGHHRWRGLGFGARWLRNLGLSMKAEHAASLLAKTPLFAGLDESELLGLGACAHRRSYHKGEYIFHQGDTGSAVFVLTEGRVKVIFASEDGDEMILATLQPPDVFGELALIDGGPRSASIQTLEPTTVLTLTRATLLNLMSRQPGVTDVVLRSLGRLVRRMIAQAGDLVFMDLHGRVAKLLLRLIEDSADPPGDGLSLDLKMTQSDLAAMVGGSRQSVNQILHQFERRGYLRLEGQRLIVEDVDALRRRAGFPAS